MKLFFSLLIAIGGIQAQAVAVNPNITPNDPLPRRVLDCGGSIITELGSRLLGVPDSGSSVNFSNGGGSVSYDVIPAIRNSRIGDHVLVCLVYVPSPCPPGDERGKIYTVTNLRTLESWSESDSEHSCGGA